MQRQDKPLVLLYTFIYSPKDLNSVAHNYRVILIPRLLLKVDLYLFPGSVQIFEKQNREFHW